MSCTDLGLYRIFVAACIFLVPRWRSLVTHVCTFAVHIKALFYPSTSSTPHVRADPSSKRHTSSVIIKLRHGDTFFSLIPYIRAKRVSNCYMQEKKNGLCVDVCVDVRLILVLVLGRQIVYGQNTVYLCLTRYIVFENTQQYKHHVVRSIARSGVSPPGGRSDGHHWCQAARTAATCT